jgi:hypothetical protein
MASCVCINGHAPIKKIFVTSSKHVKQFIKIDNQHRYRGVNCDLYSLSEVVQNTSRWDYSLPTIKNISSRYFPHARISRTIDTFIEHLVPTGIINILNKFLGVPGIILAGGAVYSALTNSVINDFDLYIVGISDDDERVKLVKQFTEELWKYEEFTLRRTNGCWTWDSNPPIQLIARNYSTISEVIHGFDNGAAAVAFDGKEVYFTSSGFLTYTTSQIVVNLTRKRATYEKRLRKYSSRYFGLILPNLDIDLINEGMNIRLGKMTVFITALSGLQITGYLDCNYYEETDYGNIMFSSRFQIMKYNIRHSLCGKYQYLCVLINDNPFETTAYMPEGVLRKFYKEMGISICNGTCRLSKLKAYTLPLVGEMFYKASITKNKEEAQQLIDNGIDIMVGWLTNNAANQIKLNWMEVEEGTTLVSPFDLVKTTKKEWYGDYYCTCMYF